ncbi:MAG: rod shape-determining protein RodA [Eubacterium sp.]|nr:rod shape-determining protein RodA [Eubacterium sp.]
MLKQFDIRNYRFRLIAYVLILTLIGIMVIGSAKESVQDKQILGLCMGLVFMVFVSLIDYSHLLRFWAFIYLFAIILLVVVLSPLGTEVNGAQRWISLPGLQFQPSELCKVLLILFFAAFFTRYHEYLNTFKMLAITIILIGIPLFLIYEEPDLSTTILTAGIFIILLFIAGLSYKIILTVLSAGIPAIIVFLFLISKQMIPFINEYQVGRILAWINPEKYADTAYQQQNAIMAIGSGQIWGKGLNNNSITSVKNGNFISEPQTDFIFSIVGEELGFVGCSVVIILLFLIVFECVLVGRKAKDLAGRLICCGVAAWIGFQSFINICVNTGLMPNTGLPLPFVSYGLTSLLCLYIGIGLVLNVGLQPNKYGSGDIV